MLLQGFAYISGEEISVDRFFLTVNLFGLVEYATCDMFATALYLYPEGTASVKRIQVRSVAL